MRFGLFLTSQFPPDSDPQTGLDQVVAQAQLAEASGFDSIFLGHHYLAHSAFLQPVSTAAYLAARTERVRIGFGVHLLPLHNPLAMAEELATLDVLTGGRLIVGFGAGYRRREFEAFGIPFEERFKRLDEAVPLLRRLWQGESVTHDGMFGRLDNARVNLRPVQDGGPPVWLGAFGPRGIRRVAEHDASWLAAPEGNVQTLRERLTGLRDELTKRDLPLARAYPLSREAVLAPTTKAATEIAREHLAAQYAAYKSWDQAQALSIDQIIAEHALVGTPEDVLPRLMLYRDELGITDVILRVQWSGMPDELAVRSIKTFGAEVIPALAG